MRTLASLLVVVVALAVACDSGDGGPNQSPTPGDPGVAAAALTAEPTPTPPPFVAPDDLPAITLDDIFGPAPERGLKLDPAKIRTLVATGDVIPARWVDRQIRALGNDFHYPLAGTAELLREADLAVINLEAPLIEGCPPQEANTFTFCGQPGFADALAEAGVDVATLENNHIGNFGAEGVAATEALLAEKGIDHADRDTLAAREVSGLRFGFIAFNGVGEAFDREAIRLRIEEAVQEVDVLVAAFHWGAEYVSLPQAGPGVAPDDPVEIAHLAVDAGADLVLGNHPHWVQAVEVYEGKLIAYAHGNFIFDQMWSRETSVGVVGRYTFYGERLLAVEYLPVVIEDYSRPRPLEGEEAQGVLDSMQQASLDLREVLAATSP
jgi:hypothetical protein